MKTAVKRTMNRIALAMLACIVALATGGDVPAKAALQEEDCSTFEDWRDNNANKYWHQHSSSPRPWNQRPGDWELERTQDADGRQHNLAPGETRGNYWAHHYPCFPD